MIVKCEKCGKRFNYEKCDGICRHCGRYMSIPDNVLVKEENGNISAKQTNTKWTEAQKISCTFIAILMVAAFISVVYTTKKQVAYETAKREVGVVEKNQAAFNQKLSLGNGILEITGCGIKEEWNSQAPEGYQLVYIEYEIKKEHRGYFRYYTDIYIKLPSDTYLKPLHEYRLGEELGIAGRDMEKEHGIYNELREEKGQLLFLVPAEIKKADFEIYYYSTDEFERSRDGTDVLEAVYEMPVSWEVQ